MVAVSIVDQSKPTPTSHNVELPAVPRIGEVVTLVGETMKTVSEVHYLQNPNETAFQVIVSVG